MPKKAKPLGALAVSRIAAPGLHAVGTVAGLHLQVGPTGGRSWILRVKVGAKRKDIGLGGYPDVPLALAHEKAREARESIVQGVDPVAARREAERALRAAQVKALSFRAAAVAYVEEKASEWKNAKHGQQWLNTLEAYAYPVMGSMDVGDVETEHVLAALQPIWRTKTTTAHRLRGRIESVLAYGDAKAKRQRLNPARWRGNLDKLLANPSKVARVQHHPALPVREVGAFMRELRNAEGLGARALEFAILTAARSGEARGALWSEIDLDAATWTIPAQRMKAESEHRVPLSAAALALLKAQPRTEGCDLVFPSTRETELSDMTLSAVVRRMNAGEKPRWVDPRSGRQVVPHGFRSTFRDWAAECTSYPSAAAEMALAHTIGNKVEAAYRRGDMFEVRRPMMEDWARLCATVQPAAPAVAATVDEAPRAPAQSAKPTKRARAAVAA